MQRLNLFTELKSVSAGRLFQGATTRSVKKCFLIPVLIVLLVLDTTGRRRVKIFLFWDKPFCSWRKQCSSKCGQNGQSYMQPSPFQAPVPLTTDLKIAQPVTPDVGNISNFQHYTVFHFWVNNGHGIDWWTVLLHRGRFVVVHLYPTLSVAPWIFP